MQNRNVVLESENKALWEALNSIYNSKIWRTSKIYRKPLDFIKVSIKNVSYKLKKQPKDFSMRFAWNFRHNFYLPTFAFGISAHEYNRQQNDVFPKSLKFSILLPLCNTKKTFLRETIASVLFQSYANWELLIADASDEKHAYVGEICADLAEQDSRIKYKKSNGATGTGALLNDCLGMSDNTGGGISPCWNKAICCTRQHYTTQPRTLQKKIRTAFTLTKPHLTTIGCTA